MIAHVGSLLFALGFGALGWWAASAVADLYRPLRLGMSYRVYLLIPRVYGLVVRTEKTAQDPEPQSLDVAA